MIPTVYIDDTTLNGKKKLRELRQYKKDIRFDDVIADESVPEVYMTSEHFWKEADKRIINVCKRYGVL